MQYKVLIGCESDKKKKRYETGEIIEDGDFPKAVIANWVEIGVLEPIAEKAVKGGKNGKE